MRPGGLTIVGGGEASAQDLAALTAAITLLLEEERGEPGDPLPAAYRSRWRRAGMVENTQVPSRVKDGGPGWEGLA